MARKSKKSKSADILENPQMTTEDLMKRTQAVEEEKQRKKAERLAKKKEKERKRKQEQLEKLVAPFLLILTIIVSLVVKYFS